MCALPTPRGRLTANRDLSGLTWLRVGGPAEWLFQPEDAADLAAFLAALDPEIPVFPMGVGSNLIVRDGGLPGVVIKLGRPFMDIAIAGETVTAGAAALDARVATAAAEAGIDLTFLRTIPGALGGAVRMNAGCYGSYIADHFVSAAAVLRDGTPVTLGAGDVAFSYRQTDIPEGAVITSVTLRGQPGDSDALRAKMDGQLAKRDATQPTKALTAGSTFRNPAGYSSTGRADDVHDLKAWARDRQSGHARRAARRGPDQRDAFELFGQYRHRHRRRFGRIGRRGAKKGIRDPRDHLRMGNHAGRQARQRLHNQ